MGRVSPWPFSGRDASSSPWSCQGRTSTAVSAGPTVWAYTKGELGEQYIVKLEFQ